MAEAIFTQIFRGRAVSAGLEPADKVDENVVAVLKEIGVESRDLHPKKLTKSILEEADKIITFKCYDGIPVNFRYKTENWDIGAESHEALKDIYSIEYLRKVRDHIHQKIQKLVQEA